MTKATAGERFVAKWLGCSVRKLRGYSGASSLVEGIENMLARERAKVAEDVLAMAWNGAYVDGRSYVAFAEQVRAKYGK